MNDDEFLRSLVRGFQGEARDILRRITPELLDLERPDLPADQADRARESVARGLHTLKGTTATLGLADLARQMHELEDLLAPALERRSTLSGDVLDRVLEALDRFAADLAAQVDDEGATPEAPGPAPAVEPTASEGWRIDQRQVGVLLHHLDRLRELHLRVSSRARDADRVRSLPRLDPAVAAPLDQVASSLTVDARELADVVAEIEESLRDVATLPLRVIIEPLHRAVRDQCRANGKEARLEVVGADVAVDRRLLDVLRAALVHLVRNAVDHGLEPPADRLAADKDREGTITIRVGTRGSLLTVEVADDGRGIDHARIREVAAARGLRGAEQLRDMDDAAVRDLIFDSGFSTATAVTTTSGRGMGLDAVRDLVEGAEGRVEVASTSRGGTRFVLTVPTALEATTVLVVRLGEQHVGLPLHAVERVGRPGDVEVHDHAGQRVAVVRGEAVVVDDLAARLGLPGASGADTRPLVTVQHDDLRRIVQVDAVERDLDLVVRPLPEELAASGAWIGAGPMPRGDLLLVLDPAWVVRTGPATTARAPTGRVLVVDDALAVRALHRAMLESGGYEVHVAPSAAAAMELLRAHPYDAVVVDVRMEGTDGLSLTRWIRAQAKLRELPVLLVSAHEAGAREQGAAVGANGFLSKAECADGRLVRTVRELVGGAR